jgi:twitching motility protein PilT
MTGPSNGQAGAKHAILPWCGTARPPETVRGAEFTKLYYRISFWIAIFFGFIDCMGALNLRALILLAKEEGASDLHLEPGLAPVLRVRGALRAVGEPCAPEQLLESARGLIGEAHWPEFLQRRSFDMSKTLEGVRCRLNILQSSRGVGFAVRLLPAFLPTLDSLNLLPDLKHLVSPPHGLVVVSGATGCGKSTTLAALIQTINLNEARHIITIESPIEFMFRPRRAFIRQREVGRDTPSFEQALLDSLREDPDVLMVGEMREPETMRLTLNAAETGHLVLATVHSSNCIEALQRIISAFPAEIQSNIAAQLADCLIGVVAQRLQFRPAANFLVPECEVLMSTLPIKNFIRNRDFFKIISSIETGAEHGMWTFARYRSWLDKRTSFHSPARREAADEDERAPGPAEIPSAPAPSLAPRPRTSPPGPPPASSAAKGQPAGTQRIEIEPTEEFEKILKPKP